MLILADDESGSPLRILDSGQFVEVGLPFQQEVHGSGMAVVRGIVEWRPLPVVLRHDVRSFLQEELETILAALLACNVDRRALLLVLGLKITSTL